MPQDLARDVAVLLDGFPLLDVVEISSRTGLAADEIAQVYYALSERYGMNTFLTRITDLPRTDRFTALARSSLRYDLYAAISGITEGVLRATPAGGDPVARIEAWENANVGAIDRARATFTEIAAIDSHDLATLSVALRAIRTLAAINS